MKTCPIEGCPVEPDVGLVYCWKHRSGGGAASRSYITELVTKEERVPKNAASGPKITPEEPGKPGARTCKKPGCKGTFELTRQSRARQYCDEHVDRQSKLATGRDRWEKKTPEKLPDPGPLQSVPAPTSPSDAMITFTLPASAAVHLIRALKQLVEQLEVRR